MVEDRERTGWAHWHVTHQHPGAWVCTLHGQLLRESVLKSTGVQRFGWCLPSPSQLREVLDQKQVLRPTEQAAVQRLAHLIEAVVAEDNLCRIDRAQLHLLYQRRLREYGLMRSGRFDWSQINHAFLAYAHERRCMPEMRAFGSTPSEIAAQLGRLLRAPRCDAHPLWHLYLIDWLFENHRDFVSQWATSQSSANELSELPKMEAQCATDARRSVVLDMLKTNGVSMRAAASKVGVDTATVMAWAASAGIASNRRSKVLTPEKRAILEAGLRDGADKAEVADTVGVSIATVTRTLLTTPGLHEHWQKTRERRVRTSHRQTWRRLCASHFGAGTKILRSVEPATYAWLYRNDRDWLRGQTPERQATRNRGISPLVWRERDTRLHQAVQEAALQLARDKVCKRIYLWMLYQAVPDLRPMLSRLDQLPLTKRCIEQALAWRGPAVFTSSLPF